MRQRASKPCPGRGIRSGRCPNLIKRPETCCEECKPYEKEKIRRYDKKRDESPERQFLHTRLWRRIRDNKLNQDPLCERCLIKRMTVPAVLVHHIDHNELNNQPENHMSTCNACHELLHKDGRFGRDKK